MLERLSLLISTVFSPMIAFIYGILIIIYQNGLTDDVKIGTIIIFLQVILFSYIVSFVILRQTINLTLETAIIKQRLVVYGASFTGFLLEWIWCRLLGIHTYEFLSISGMITLSAAGIITYYWLISAHAAAFACTSSVLMYSMPPMFTAIALVLLFLICSARLYLRKHTLAQVLAGTILGFSSSFIANQIGNFYY